MGYLFQASPPSGSANPCSSAVPSKPHNFFLTNPVASVCVCRAILSAGPGLPFLWELLRPGAPATGYSSVSAKCVCLHAHGGPEVQCGSSIPLMNTISYLCPEPKQYSEGSKNAPGPRTLLYWHVCTSPPSYGSCPWHPSSVPLGCSSPLPHLPWCPVHPVFWNPPSVNQPSPYF